MRGMWRDDAQGASLWPILILAGLFAVLLVLPSQVVVSRYVNDLLIFLDGAYRVNQGQVPNRDFHTALGPLNFYLPALAARITGTLGTAMPVRDVEASCRIVRATVGDAPHPVVASVVVATGHGGQERVDGELPHWGTGPGEDAGVAGNADEVATYLRRLAAAGVTSVAVHPTRDEPDLPGLLPFVGEQVRPLLS